MIRKKKWDRDGNFETIEGQENYFGFRFSTNKMRILAAAIILFKEILLV